MTKYKLRLSLIITAFILIYSAALIGFENTPEDPHYLTADTLPAFQQADFDLYLKETEHWLRANRVFDSADEDKEIKANLPYEIKPENPNGQGVLLVHGLGDSPFSFIDIAEHLAQQGYLVRTVLLPGHGSKVGDLILPTLADWQGVVAHHTQLLKQDVDQVWLGGFSTGANLVTSQAINDDEITGLLLFAPAFKSGTFVAALAPAVSHFMTWADRDPEDNYTRYNSLPMNAAAVYYQTSEIVRDALEKAGYDKPVFMMMSEGEHVIDTDYAQSMFSQMMTNTSNKLVWKGEVQPDDTRAVRFSMDLPQQRISNGSHVGLLFSPLNPVYGPDGEITICDNGQREVDEAKCQAGEEVWYSAYGYQEPGKVYARLSWNPYFAESMAILDDVMQQGTLKSSIVLTDALFAPILKPLTLSM
ncbi:carboxylesterase [Moritella sp. F3]|uniref:alpha/beta hydrolase n=1 Tax=Moritella sp. F3 TaxID=2718882 RepID=UPI0018E1C224|nr:alpha/beta fold hydrolase [Moritella sp. F3]